jgi:hypothetical protein
MRLRYFLPGILCFLVFGVNAQGLLKGTVYENGSNKRLPDVFIRDINNKQLALTDRNGNFGIKTEKGHLLIFESPGYLSDTLFVVDMTSKKIQLETKTIALSEVNINATRQAFNPQKEYPEVYEKSKLYILSPSSWFGKDAKDARRLKRYFKRETEERHIDAVFTRAYVGSIVPLKGQDLEDFITMYRPTYAFIMDNNGPSLVAYINDCYKKYKALPPDKRSLPKLKDTSGSR